MEDVLSSADAGRRVIRGSVWRVAGNLLGILAGLGTATLLLRHLGVAQSGRYVTVLSLVAVATSVVDHGLNISASRELALRDSAARRELMADVIGQRLWVAPIAALVIVAFAVLAGYPVSMQIGAAIASGGLCVVAYADALLLPLTVGLRNAELAFVDFLKQAITLVGVAALVAVSAHLIAFFAVLLLVGLAVVAITPALLGFEAFVRPRLNRPVQRDLLRRALPLGIALVLGALYFRIVILLMSLISSPKQTGWYGGSLRATEGLIAISVMLAGVAMPLLAAAARDDRERLRYAICGLSEGAILVGVLAVLLAARAAEPVMRLIGGADFVPSGAVLRIQVVALLFGTLTQIWGVSLVALGRQRELILTNGLGLLGLALFAAMLVPAFGAQGGAWASALGDTLLASLTWWRLRAGGVRASVRAGFLWRVALAALAAALVLLIPGMPDLLAAALGALTFLGVGQLIGMVPPEVHDALGFQRLLWWRAGSGET